jgi:Mn-dependent DtxR family transcriptional regulator
MGDDILRIVKEDLLEVLGKMGKVSASSIEPEIKVSSSFILEAIEELERGNLIKAEGNLIFLTEEGSKRAENIIKKHSVIENYFKKTRSKEEAWKAASVLEHYVSEEVIDNIKKLSTLRKEGIPLTELKQEKGLITNIIFDPRLFERVISMGISPGERIKITNKLPDSIIVEIENKKFALDKSIAKGIRVLNIEQVLV